MAEFLLELYSEEIPPKLQIGARNQLKEFVEKPLKEENINIKVITTSEIKISVLIDRKYLELAIQALHDTFELES